jgi:hypothetical protein
MSQHFCRGVDLQDLGLALLEARIASLQIVAHFVRLDRLTIQYLVHRTGGQFRQAAMADRRSVFACMRRQQTQRPPLVWIAALLGFDAGLADQPGASRFRELGPSS